MANEQTSMFPLFCAEQGHEYEPAQDGYYKQSADGEPIKNKVYRMIFCIKCGDNREIMVVDRTLATNESKASNKKTVNKRRRN